MNKIIEAIGLKKSYGPVEAVGGIDFYAEQGKMFALLGPNGAGKSTTIDILCTLLQPDGGEVSVDGHVLGKEDSEIRSKIGVVFQDNMLDPLLTVRENLQIRAGFYKMSAAKLKESVTRAAAAADVTGFMDRRYGKLSGGQRRRSDIARALINTPKILFLDEPTTGLDPQTRKSIWESVQRLQRENEMSVFMTTHYMEEAAAADYVIIIDDGKIAAKGTPDELRQKYSSDILRLHSSAPETLSKVLDGMKLDYSVKSSAFVVQLPGTLQALPIIERCKDLVSDVEIIIGSMDDAFIAVTGKEMRA